MTLFKTYDRCQNSQQRKEMGLNSKYNKISGDLVKEQIRGSVVRKLLREASKSRQKFCSTGQMELLLKAGHSDQVSPWGW